MIFNFNNDITIICPKYAFVHMHDQVKDHGSLSAEAKCKRMNSLSRKLSLATVCVCQVQ